MFMVKFKRLYKQSILFLWRWSHLSFARHSYVSGVSELAVKALGRLLYVSGPPTVSSIELLLNQCFGYIEEDDARKKLAVSRAVILSSCDCFMMA